MMGCNHQRSRVALEGRQRGAKPFELLAVVPLSEQISPPFGDVGVKADDVDEGRAQQPIYSGLRHRLPKNPDVRGNVRESRAVGAEIVAEGLQ